MLGHRSPEDITVVDLMSDLHFLDSFVRWRPDAATYFIHSFYAASILWLSRNPKIDVALVLDVNITMKVTVLCNHLFIFRFHVGLGSSDLGRR
jgi:hypothetical protein